MAFTPNQYLNDTSNVLLRDWRHAARLFTDDQFRLAPKQKFQFHVSFSINRAALLDTTLVQRHGNEINLLVRSIDLPGYEVQTETLNQYNRKKNVQYTHKFKSTAVTFHDDNMGVINQLWQNYYNYYYADPSSSKDPGAYNRTATKNFSYTSNAYGLDNGSTTPFFNYIKIYQMARHEYVCYTLYNPLITQWNHNKVDYQQGGAHDNTMTLAYEAVSYDVGEVSSGNPEGFASEHYDQTPSPLQSAGGLTSSSPSFVNQTTINPANYLDNIITSINTYQNTQTLQPAGTQGLLSNVISTAVQGVSGVQGISFPVTSTNSSVITAKKINLGL